MAARNSVTNIVSSLTRSTSTQSPAYICQPCLASSLITSRAQQHHLSPSRSHPQNQQQRRHLHGNRKPAPAPQPTPFVPDVATFMTLIGRKLSTHTGKISSWDKLFTLTSPQLKELGIEPTRTRRYLLRWREKFRRGEYGIGGDFQHVTDGVGELRVVEVPRLPSATAATEAETASASQTPGMTKLILNVPAGSTTYQLGGKGGPQTTAELKKPAHVTLRNGHTIEGSYVQPIKGTNGSGATLKVTEGMWEDRRGHKVHGGERRRAEVLHKLRAEERKKNER